MEADTSSRELVYGYVDDEKKHLGFIPRSDALRLKAIWEALNSAKTWGGLRTMLPEGAYGDYLVSMGEIPTSEDGLAEIREILPHLSLEEAREEYMKLPIGERLPEDSDAFVFDEAPLLMDGDWPEWPAQAMLGWVPRDIQERFGRVESSMISGEALYLHGDIDEVVQAFEKHAYRCVRDEELVLRACGYGA